MMRRMSCGPQVLSWIDICAGLAAKTVARGPVVTASVDTVHFLRPCHQGSVAIIAAMVNRVFQSSMEASAWAPPACCAEPHRKSCALCQDVLLLHADQGDETVQPIKGNPRPHCWSPPCLTGA